MKLPLPPFRTIYKVYMLQLLVKKNAEGDTTTEYPLIKGYPFYLLHGMEAELR